MRLISALFVVLSCLIVINSTEVIGNRIFAEETNLITLPVSVYMIDDESDKLTTPSHIETILLVLDGVNEIWSQAGIRFEIKYVGRIALPDNINQEIASGNYKLFLEGKGVKFQMPKESPINIYYAYEVGLLNGITLENNIVIVKDSSALQMERVTAHELGHVLGLGHENKDALRLMYPGTSGTVLTQDEVKTARENSQTR